MKIGYMYRMHVSPPKGGNHVHALELVQGFLKEGHEVHLLEDPTVPGAISFPGTTEEELKAFVNSVDVLYIRVDARHLGKWPAIEPCMRLAGDRPVVWEINAPANESLAFSWLGGRRLNVKESFFRKLKRRVHALRQMPGIWKEEKLRKRLGERVDAAICVSTALQGYAQKTLGIDNAIVLPNGGPLISEEEIRQRRAKRSSEQFTVFYSGSAVYPWQGLDYFSAAIELARERAPDIKFVLAVNQLSEAVPEGPNVEVRQGLNREEILDAICASDACVALHPEYFWSPYRFHGSPMKLFEYMACGTAVVTSNRGQMSELIEHGKNGLLSSDSPEDILAQLVAFRDDPTLARQLGIAGRQMILNGRSWQDNVARTLNVFTQQL
ncbi:glycosyltransferase family 4 protein [Marinobacter sp.]|uniref:glycosyltransferase family 4 protein n=1 Tax=Marinobacter sp. TaxID=50741 RepID=UPI0019AD80F6|nr:glycosyltransferase family 4 protein [Marinobacter sp.]MBC7191041.1 glycosyltransferase family 4 protein [Marinobacter sp.]